MSNVQARLRILADLQRQAQWAVRHLQAIEAAEAAGESVLVATDSARLLLKLEKAIDRLERVTDDLEVIAGGLPDVPLHADGGADVGDR